MEIGVSTACLYPQEIEVSLKKLVDMKFRVFELFFNTTSEIQPDFVRKLREIAGDSRVVSVHPFTSGFETMLLFSGYRRRFLDSLELYKRYFEAAALLGAGILVLHGQRDYQKSHFSEEEYFERYGTLFRTGKTFGVTVAQENVNQFRSERCDFISRMKHAMGDECAFVLDLKQAIRAGEDPFSMCRVMGDKLIHLHLNDHDAVRDCLLPGKGNMDYRKLSELLSSQSYCGDVILEVYRHNFGEEKELSAARTFSENFFC